MRRSWIGRRRALVAAASVGIIIIVLVAVLATRGTPSSSIAPSPLLGKIAPAAAGPNVVDGHHVSLASDRGRYVLLDFFASWCLPCQQEAPQIASFLFEHRAASDIAMLGVVVADSGANAARFLARTGATWPAIADANGGIALDYGVDDPPQMFLISPSGRVLVHVEGAETRAGLDALLAAAQASNA